MFSWSKDALKKRAALVRRVLAKQFPKPKIPLDHTDNFTFLVAVVLSAQCTDKRVNATTPELFKVAGTVEKMAAMSYEALYKIIRPCGLAPFKARNLIATAKAILEKHGGEVPATREELEALPGVGRKTASVLLTQAFGVPAFPVDTHIFRNARRWGLSRANSVNAVERDLRGLYPERLWNDLHLQIVYYGRFICTARGCCGPHAEPRGRLQRRCPMCQKLRKTETT